MLIFQKIKAVHPSLLATAIGRFRLVALLEGISYIVLLFVSMPLKYLAGLPQPVQYNGWVHGVLFVLYCGLLLHVWIVYRWSFGKVLLAFVLSLIPFGSFWLDRRLKKEYYTDSPVTKG